MEYSLEQIALLVEIIGGVAIIISLFFVGLQLKESAKATRSATAATTVSEITSWYSNLGNCEQGSKVFYNFLTNPESLTSEERYQAIMNVHGIWLLWQNSFYLVKKGTLDKGIHKSLVEIINGVKNSPGFHVFWESCKSIFLKEFQEYVEKILESDTASSMDFIRVKTKKANANNA